MAKTYRLFFSKPITIGQELTLSAEAMRHLVNVLRLKTGDIISVFNGEDPGEFSGKIIIANKKKIVFLPDKFQKLETESKTNFHLGQAIISNEKMDYLIQKATELGISSITPLFNKYGNIKIDSKKYVSKLNHWKKIAISSSEQSGRWKVPEIFSPENFSSWVAKQETQMKLIFDPYAQEGVKNITNQYNDSISFLVGPEGGFSEEEITMAKKYGFKPLNLGPRILRSETVALVVLSIL